MDAPIAFRHDESRHRFVAERDGVEVAFSDIDFVGANSLLVKHTEVLPAEEGRGYGSALLRSLFAYTRAQGRVLIPVCPFAAAFIRRNPEYRDLVRPGYPI